jgi:Protein of unknown function (DUF664)
MDSETTALLECLTQQREHVLGILEGLPGEALQQAVLPTGWTFLGLVNHLALDVERFWFREIVADEEIDAGDTASAWEVPPNRSPDEVLDQYRREIELANEVIAVTPIAAEPKSWPSFFGEWKLANLRAVLLHVIAETACHAGHLDAARELVDGRTWLILT